MTKAETAAFIAAAERGKTACRDACLELRRMVDMINADRIARGVAPLENTITAPGEAR
jgi:predicted ABC-type ATPase